MVEVVIPEVVISEVVPRPVIVTHHASSTDDLIWGFITQFYPVEEVPYEQSLLPCNNRTIVER